VTEERKNLVWQKIRDGVSISTFIFCLTILWQISAFHTTVTIYIQEHKTEHIKLDVWKATTDNHISCLRDWKVAVTQKPFYQNGVNNVSR
jgi:murein L,D-transpeptidase YafK